eukprot:Rhum_TRINITY_DN15282_c0_g1::Rhum_TRINITY_DN15282_c0_g1_i3::g.148567::m.148567
MYGSNVWLYVWLYTVPGASAAGVRNAARSVAGRRVRGVRDHVLDQLVNRLRADVRVQVDVRLARGGRQAVHVQHPPARRRPHRDDVRVLVAVRLHAGLRHVRLELVERVLRQRHAVLGVRLQAAVAQLLHARPHEGSQRAVVRARRHRPERAEVALNLDQLGLRDHALQTLAHVSLHKATELLVEQAHAGGDARPELLVHAGGDRVDPHVALVRRCLHERHDLLRLGQERVHARLERTVDVQPAVLLRHASLVQRSARRQRVVQRRLHRRRRVEAHHDLQVRVRLALGPHLEQQVLRVHLARLLGARLHLHHRQPEQRRALRHRVVRLARHEQLRLARPEVLRGEEQARVVALRAARRDVSVPAVRVLLEPHLVLEEVHHVVDEPLDVRRAVLHLRVLHVHHHLARQLALRERQHALPDQQREQSVQVAVVEVQVQRVAHRTRLDLSHVAEQPLQRARAVELVRVEARGKLLRRLRLTHLVQRRDAAARVPVHHQVRAVRRPDHGAVLRVDVRHLDVVEELLVRHRRDQEARVQTQRVLHRARLRNRHAVDVEVARRAVRFALRHGREREELLRVLQQHVVVLREPAHFRHRRRLHVEEHGVRLAVAVQSLARLADHVRALLHHRRLVDVHRDQHRLGAARTRARKRLAQLLRLLVLHDLHLLQRSSRVHLVRVLAHGHDRDVVLHELRVHLLLEHLRARTRSPQHRLVLSQRVVPEAGRRVHRVARSVGGAVRLHVQVRQDVVDHVELELAGAEPDAAVAVRVAHVVHRKLEQPQQQLLIVQRQQRLADVGTALRVEVVREKCDERVQLRLVRRRQLRKLGQLRRRPEVLRRFVPHCGSPALQSGRADVAADAEAGEGSKVGDVRKRVGLGTRACRRHPKGCHFFRQAGTQRGHGCVLGCFVSNEVQIL